MFEFSVSRLLLRWLQRVCPTTSLAFAGAMIASLNAASAQMTEVCVECSEPAKVYVCQVEKGEKVASYRAGFQALQYLCVTELARIGKHDICKARRSAENCLGVIHTVSLADIRRSITEAVVPPRDDAAGTPKSDDQARPKAEADTRFAPEGATKPAQAPPKPAVAKTSGPQPPRTVKELAEKTLDATQEQAKAAGDAVSDGLSKSWKCISTLFQKC